MSGPRSHRDPSPRRPDPGGALAVGLALSALVHVAVLLLNPGLPIAGATSTRRAIHLVALPETAPTPAPPVVDAPAPREPVSRPGPPVLELGSTPTVEPTYIPHDIPPRLENPAHVQQLLESLYPVDYRDAGIGDVVELWLFVNDEGRVVRALVRTPSRYAAFNVAAREVAASMEYRPAFNRGKPVGVWVSQPIRFVALGRSAAPRPAPAGSPTHRGP